MSKSHKPRTTRVVDQHERDEMVENIMLGVMLVEAFGHLDEAWANGWSELVTDHQWNVILAIAPASVGGTNREPEVIEIWNMIRQTVLADPERQGMITAMRQALVNPKRPSLASSFGVEGNPVEQSVTKEVIKLFK